MSIAASDSNKGRAARGADTQDYKLRPDNRAIDHLPGDYGLPVLGNTLRALYNFNQFLYDQHEKYGVISRTYIGMQRMVIALGPELNQQILLDKKRDFSSEMGYKRNMGPFFGGGIMLRDFDEHRMQRRIMQNAFKTDALRGYIEVMNPLLSAGLDRWPEIANFHFYEHIKPLLLRVAAKIFIGVKDIDDRALHAMNQAFLDAVNGLRSVIQKPWIGTKYRKGITGRAYLYRFFQEMLPAKRKGAEGDMLSRFASELDENGTLFSDDDVITHIIFLMMAAHDTTTSALSSAVFELAALPEWQHRLREESQALGKKQLEYDDLDKLESMDLFFHEVLRAHSPVPMSTRRTVREVELGGYAIPADTIISVTPTFSHHMAEWWDHPEKFDPMRFSPERAEHKRHSFNFIPFGGGAHKCIGMHFAAMQVKAFLHQLLTRFEVSAPPGYTERALFLEVPFPHPKDGLPLKLTPLA